MSVYFLLSADEQLVKIGCSIDPEARAQQLNSTDELARSAKLLGFIDGGFDREKSIHAELKAFRRIGEWFAFTDSVREHVEGLDLKINKVATRMFDQETADWLDTLPISLIRDEIKRRGPQPRGRQPILRPCPKCGRQYGAMEMRLHKPTCNVAKRKPS